MEEVIMSEHPWGVTITLDRPPVNAASTSLVVELEEAVTRLARDEPSVVVLRGSGKHFCAGADLKDSRADVASNLFRQEKMVALERSLHTAPFPTVAAVHGACMGLGMLIAALCDIRVAREDAVFALPEVARGRCGGFTAIRPLVPGGYARFMALTGERVPAAEALRVGLVEKMIPADQWDEEIEALAGGMAGHGRAALYAVKGSITRTESMGPELGMWAEHQVAYQLWTQGYRTVGGEPAVRTGPSDL